MFRQDPGPCPICGAAHTACRADAGPVVVAQLPQRDAVGEVQSTEPPAELASAVDEPPVEFSTSDYSRKVHGRPRRTP